MAKADPLPYVIIFAILFIVALIVTTWVIGTWYQSYQCASDPNIWCSDTWVCNTPCPTGTSEISPCYSMNAATGLASCLYGPNSMLATVCLTTAPTGGTGTTGTHVCNCPSLTANAQNCLAGCALSLAAVPSGTNCCFKNSPNCA